MITKELIKEKFTKQYEKIKSKEFGIEREILNEIQLPHIFIISGIRANGF